jgi:hypothetical protein
LSVWWGGGEKFYRITTIEGWGRVVVGWRGWEGYVCGGDGKGGWEMNGVESEAVSINLAFFLSSKLHLKPALTQFTDVFSHLNPVSFASGLPPHALFCLI